MTEIRRCAIFLCRWIFLAPCSPLSPLQASFFSFIVGALSIIPIAVPALFRLLISLRVFGKQVSEEIHSGLKDMGEMTS